MTFFTEIDLWHGLYNVVPRDKAKAVGVIRVEEIRHLVGLQERTLRDSVGERNGTSLVDLRKESVYP